MKFFRSWLSVDWILLGSIVPLLLAGLVTMYSFTRKTPFFSHQLIWIFIGCAAFFFFSRLDVRFLRRTDVLVGLYLLFSALLALLFLAGKITNGAQSWFSFGGFSFQPADPMKLVLILILAKYFSRRHIEIAHIRHILVSAVYAFI